MPRSNNHGSDRPLTALEHIEALCFDAQEQAQSFLSKHSAIPASPANASTEEIHSTLTDAARRGVNIEGYYRGQDAFAQRVLGLVRTLKGKATQW